MNIDLSSPHIMLSIAFGSAILALFYAFFRSQWVIHRPSGSDLMIKIAENIDKGANAFMKREYGTLAVFVLIVTLLLFVFFKSSEIALAFAFGAICSALAGYYGMHTATAANVRTTQAARTDLNRAMNVAFAGGSVMGMAVVGLALAGLSILIYVFSELSGGSYISCLLYTSPSPRD